MRLLEKLESTPVALFLWAALAWPGALGLLSPGGVSGSPRRACRTCVCFCTRGSVHGQEPMPAICTLGNGVCAGPRPPTGWALCASPSPLPIPVLGTWATWSSPLPGIPSVRLTPAPHHPHEVSRAAAVVSVGFQPRTCGFVKGEAPLATQK